MEYAKLGITELSVSRLGFGCWAIGGHGYGKVDDAESIRAIRRAVDLGVNFFDTADVYGFGHSEKVLSEALGEQRHDVVIATKFGVRWDAQGHTEKDISPTYLRTALEASLRRLNIDVIPLYQIHCYDNRTPLEETMQALVDFQRQGKIRHIGVSNFSLDLMQKVAKISRIESLQTEYNVLQPLNPDLASFLKEQSIHVIAYNVLMRGLLSGKYNTSSCFDEGDTRQKDKHFQGPELDRYLKAVEKFKIMGEAKGFTPSQMAIRLLLNDPLVASAIVGAKTAEQVESNVAAVHEQKV